MDTEKKGGFLSFLAFVAILVIAVLEIFGALEHFNVLTVGGTLINILNTIKNICVVLVIGILGFKFASGRGKVIKIIFILCIAIIIVATVLMWL